MLPMYSTNERWVKKLLDINSLWLRESSRKGSHLLTIKATDVGTENSSAEAEREKGRTQSISSKIREEETLSISMSHQINSR